MRDPIRFPNGFLWRAATSAYQIEGSPLADGARPSIWHRFVHSPGRTAGGETGDVAWLPAGGVKDAVDRDAATPGAA